MQADVPPPPIINNVTMAEAEKAKQEIYNTEGIKKKILVRLIFPTCCKRVTTVEEVKATKFQQNIQLNIIKRGKESRIVNKCNMMQIL